MVEITSEEQAVLDEMKENPVIRIPALGTPRDEERAERLRLLKGMVYKNLILFDVDFDTREYGFISKDLVNK